LASAWSPNGVQNGRQAGGCPGTDRDHQGLLKILTILKTLCLVGDEELPFLRVFSRGPSLLLIEPDKPDILAVSG
jgi:hypothetical protein